MPEAAQLFFSAVIGALAGAFAAAYKSRKELESLYDIELRRRRIDAYVPLETARAARALVAAAAPDLPLPRPAFARATELVLLQRRAVSLAHDPGAVLQSSRGADTTR